MKGSLTPKDKKGVLLRTDRYLFHTQDLALLWGIREANTLYTTIKRYVKKGILHRIHKGFYSTVPPERINPVRLGLKALHRFAYLSTESILQTKGALHQELHYITLVSDISKKFDLLGNAYRVRKMSPYILHDHEGILRDKDVYKATPERALADLLYFHPNYYLDSPKGIDMERVRELQERFRHR